MYNKYGFPHSYSVFLEDGGMQFRAKFRVSNPVTIEAKGQAEHLLEWCLIEANKEKLDAFTEHILQDLIKGTIVLSATKSFRYNKDKMWRGFFSLRTSEDFNKQWTNFLGNSGVQAKPVLYQHLTDVLFRMLIKKHFEIYTQIKVLPLK